MQQLTNEQRKIIASKRVNMAVSPFEAQIIKHLRKMDHGRFIVQMMDGVPYKFVTEESFLVLEETDSEQVLQQVAKGGI